MPHLDYSQITYIKKRRFTKKRKLESKPRKSENSFFGTLFVPKLQNLGCNDSIDTPQAANRAGIKYSSAKTILFAHRKSFKDNLIRDKLAALNCLKHCGFKKAELGSRNSQVKVVSRIGCQ